MADHNMSKETGVDRLIPVHPGGEFKKHMSDDEKGIWRDQYRESRLVFGLTKQPGRREASTEARRARREALYDAPNLEELLQAEAQRQGIQVPPNTNLSLVAIGEFQQKVREAQDLRKVVKNAQDPEDQIRAMTLYSTKQGEISEYLDLGLSFEQAYREYLKARNEYVVFSRNLKCAVTLERQLSRPVFASVADDGNLDERARARMEQLMRQTGEDDVDRVDTKLQLEALETIYPKGTPEYRNLAQKLQARNTEDVKLATKKDVRQQLSRLEQEIQRAWENSMVRWFWQNKQIANLSQDFAKGEDVLETQSVVVNLNKLHEWENEHQRTTIGGVLVGPPGVGKTTLIRHYLETTGRRSVYIDLSEDVTRYTLYGSKSIDFKSTSELHREFLDELTDMDNQGFQDFVRENAKNLMETFGVSGDEATVALIAQMMEAVGEDGDEGLSAEKIKELRAKIQDLAQKSYHRELGSEFQHLVKRNGWRDGMIIAALRRGESVILDEFNKNRNWSLIFGLMTAKPGEDWYFADNDEWISIPQNWRMYFTANIGRKHGGFEVPEALASRAGGKVMEVDYPPFEEEMRVALVALSDSEGTLLRSKEDSAKLYVAIHELFPKIRTFIEDRRQTVPISYRTIRDLGEKLVLTRDRQSAKTVYQATAKSFDRALWEVLVDTYGVYEDKTLPKEIVGLATSMGLLLDNSVKDDVIKIIMILTDGEGNQAAVEPIIRQIEEDDQVIFLAVGMGQTQEESNGIIQTYIEPLSNLESNVFGISSPNLDEVLPQILDFLKREVGKRAAYR